jgi:hypothetical protein
MTRIEPIAKRTTKPARCDVFQEWFAELEAMGECSQIRLGHCRSGQDPEWYELPHQRFDGIGGLTEVLKKHYGLELCQPLLSERKPPAWVRFAAALRCLFRGRPRPLSWRNLDPAWRSAPGNATPTAFAWALLSEQETRDLRDAARTRGISLNAWLLWGLTRALAPHWLPGTGNVSWIVPINMRGTDQIVQPNSNQASTLELSFAVSADALSVDAELHRERQRCAHWGVWLLLSMMTHLGAAFVRRLARYEAHAAKHGSFSNLGQLRARSGSPELVRNDWWLAFNTVQEKRPVGAACLTWNNRLAITLQVHPVLSRDPAMARDWLDRWLLALTIPGAIGLTADRSVPQEIQSAARD